MEVPGGDDRRVRVGGGWTEIAYVVSDRKDLISPTYFTAYSVFIRRHCIKLYWRRLIVLILVSRKINGGGGGRNPVLLLFITETFTV